MPSGQLSLGLEVSLTESHLRAAHDRTRWVRSIPFEEALSRPAVAAALRATAKAALSCRLRGATPARRRRR